MATASNKTIDRGIARNVNPKAHPFLPRRLQSPTFLIWLRRSHGWLGIWGALAGVLFGVTTALMVPVELGGEPVEQPRRFAAYFASASEVVDARYVDGNRFVDIEHTERGFLSTLNRLHLAANTGIVWVLIIDAFSGALVVFSITGLLLWSRLTGPRLLAIGLAGSMLAGTLYYAIVL